MSDAIEPDALVVNADHGVGFVIQDIYAYLCIHDDGDEGIVGVQLADGAWLPLIAADLERLSILADYAEGVSRRTGKQIKLVRFTVREDLEVVNPPGG